MLKPVSKEKILSKEECLEILSKNLNEKSLNILAEKSKKVGINTIINQFKNLI